MSTIQCMILKRSYVLSVIVLVLGSVETTPARAEFYGLIIGCNYRHARFGEQEMKYGLTPLRFAVKDAFTLRDTLHHYNGIDENRMTVITDGDANHAPTLQELQTEVAAIFAGKTQEDTVLFFFSGHGIRGDSNESYLLPPSYRTPNGLRGLPQEALSLRFLEEHFARCAAGKKLCLIDACHSGAFSIHEQFTKQFSTGNEGQQNGGDAYAMLSCGANQQSYEWKKNGVFTYCLCQGLAGAAYSSDRPDEISFTKLFEYTRQRVPEIVEAQLGLARGSSGNNVVGQTGTQNPELKVALRGSPAEYPGTPFRFDPYNDAGAAFFVFSEFLDDHLRQFIPGEDPGSQPWNVWILDFTESTQNGGPTLRGASRTYGRVAAEAIAEKLARKRDATYAITSWQEVQSLLPEKFGPSDLTKKEKLLELRTHVAGQDGMKPDVLIWANLEYIPLDSKTRVNVTWNLVNLHEPQSKNAPSFTMAMLVEGEAEQMIAGKGATGFRATDPDDENTPRGVSVQIRVRSKGKQTFHDATMSPVPGASEQIGFPVSEGDEYQIVLTNHSNENRCAVVLVDGINTIDADPENLLNTDLTQPGEALAWGMEPQAHLTIDGWHKLKSEGPSSNIYTDWQFEIKGVEESTLHHFKDPIGQVQVFVYGAKDSAGAGGPLARGLVPRTGAGAQRERVYKDLPFGINLDDYKPEDFRSIRYFWAKTGGPLRN